MNVTLTPELEAIIQQKIESGDFSDEGEVVQEALRQMHERDCRLAWLRAEVAKGLEDIEQGRTIPYTPQLMDEIRERAIENARRGKPVKDAVKPKVADH
jgi:antitoxin ParD1/3/4